MRYEYVISGLAADGQQWKTEGSIVGPLEPGRFMDAIEAAMRDSFVKLTKGEAVYGKPGVGCAGPYQFTELNLKRVGA